MPRGAVLLCQRRDRLHQLQRGYLRRHGRDVVVVVLRRVPRWPVRHQWISRVSKLQRWSVRGVNRDDLGGVRRDVLRGPVLTRRRVGVHQLPRWPVCEHQWRGSLQRVSRWLLRQHDRRVDRHVHGHLCRGAVRGSGVHRVLALCRWSVLERDRCGGVHRVSSRLLRRNHRRVVGDVHRRVPCRAVLARRVDELQCVSSRTVLVPADAKPVHGVSSGILRCSWKSDVDELQRQLPSGAVFPGKRYPMQQLQRRAVRCV